MNKFLHQVWTEPQFVNKEGSTQEVQSSVYGVKEGELIYTRMVGREESARRGQRTERDTVWGREIQLQ